jgi:hypothetical protein
LGFIQEQFKTTSLSSVEKAILCSYYRCTEGCGSDEADKYCFAFWEDACSKPQLLGFSDNELRVCDWNALQFPVKVSITENEKVYKENLKDVAHCIVTSNSRGGIVWREIDEDPFRDINALRNILFISEHLLSNKKTETCNVGWTGSEAISISDALTEGEVVHTGYIFTKHSKPLSSQYFTVALDEPKYITLTDVNKGGEEVEVNLTKRNPYRVNLQPEDVDYKLEIIAINTFPSRYVDVNVSNSTHFERKSIITTGEERFMIGLYVRLNRIISDNEAELTLKYNSTLELPYPPPPIS